MTSVSVDEKARSAGFIDAIARREFILCWIIGLTCSTTQNYSALLAIVFRQSGHDLPNVGLLLSLFAIPALVGTLLSATIAGRFGILPTVRAAIALTAIGLGSLAITRGDFASALASRLVQGVGVGLFLPVTMLYVQSRLTRERFLYLVTIFTATIPLASAIAPPLGEWALANFGPTALLVESMFPAAIALLLTFFMRPGPKSEKAGGLDLAGGFKRRFLLPCVAVMMGGALYGYVVSYLPADLQSRGIPLAAFFLPSTSALLIGRFGAMRRLQHLSPPVLIAGGMAMSAVGYAFITVAPNSFVAAIAGFLLGGGNSVMWPVASAWVSQGLGPSERGAPQAVASTAFYFGIYVAPLPLTYVIAQSGFVAAEILLAIVALVMGAVLFARRTPA